MFHEVETGFGQRTAADPVQWHSGTPSRTLANRACVRLTSRAVAVWPRDPARTGSARAVKCQSYTQR